MTIAEDMSARGYQHKRFTQRITGRFPGSSTSRWHASANSDACEDNDDEDDYSDDLHAKHKSASSIIKPSSYTTAVQAPISPLQTPDTSVKAKITTANPSPIVTPTSSAASAASPDQPRFDDVVDDSAPRRSTPGVQMPSAPPLSIDERPLGRTSAASKARLGNAKQQNVHVADTLFDSGHASASSRDSPTQNEMSSAMKGMIKPFMDNRVRSSDPNKQSSYVHQPTAKGLTSTILGPSKKLNTLNSPVGKPATALRYSLKDGTKSMTEDMIETSEDLVAESQQNKLRAAHSLALKAHSRPSPSTVSASSRPSSSSRFEDSFKIFLLLLQPKSKIFELIQIIYNPRDTTIGDLIAMIPANATDDALGKQEYIGLCRPKEREDLLNMDMLASTAGVARNTPRQATARIKLGEILVAIPIGYSGEDVAKLSDQILPNPKIVKLLKRSDPLAPRSKRRSRRHRSGTGSSSGTRGSSSGKSSSRRRRSSKSVDVLEQHDERVEIEQEQNERRMRDAMAHAAAEAAAANAAIPDSGRDDQEGLRLRRAGSVGSYSEKSFTSSAQESLDDSFSSWSKSFEESFSAQSSICSGVSKRATRRKERLARRIAILKKTASVAVACMIGLFFIDPRGYGATGESKVVTESPMGLIGIFQTFFLLLTIYKVQRFLRSDGDASRRRCPFLRASAHAMESLKSRYATKLQKEAPVETHVKEGLSKRLRNFSLKHHEINADDDTGSL